MDSKATIGITRIQRHGVPFLSQRSVCPVLLNVCTGHKQSTRDIEHPARTQIRNRQKALLVMGNAPFLSSSAIRAIALYVRGIRARAARNIQNTFGSNAADKVVITIRKSIFVLSRLVRHGRNTARGNCCERPALSSGPIIRIQLDIGAVGRRGAGKVENKRLV